MPENFQKRGWVGKTKTRLTSALLVLSLSTIMFSDRLLADTLLSGEQANSSLRDPTTPLNLQVKTAARAPLRLQAIIIGEARKEAIINGMSLREGEYVRGQRIVSIHEQHLVLDSPKGRRILALRPSIHNK